MPIKTIGPRRSTVARTLGESGTSASLVAGAGWAAACVAALVAALATPAMTMAPLRRVRRSREKSSEELSGLLIVTGASFRFLVLAALCQPTYVASYVKWGYLKLLA